MPSDMYHPRIRLRSVLMAGVLTVSAGLLLWLWVLGATSSQRVTMYYGQHAIDIMTWRSACGVRYDRQGPQNWKPEISLRWKRPYIPFGYSKYDQPRWRYLGISVFWERPTAEIAYAEYGVLVPFWMIIPPMLIQPLWVLRCTVRMHRRRKLGLCLRCGYDLRATPARCPECSAEPPSPSAKHADPGHVLPP